MLCGAACMLHVTTSSADVSSWLSVGGGYGLKHNERSSDYDRATTMSFAIGVGTESTNRLVVGGILRSTTYLSLGTDLGISARIATGGFARGQWGLALDAGPMWRTFGDGQYGRWPLAGMLTLGAPWGVQLAVGGEILKIAGNDADARGVVALLELDLLRLTVMRQGSTDRWWENPSPAGGKRPVEETTFPKGSDPEPRPQSRTRPMGPLPGLLW
jgi:hypothetical protein